MRVALLLLLLQIPLIQGLYCQGFERVIVETYFENTGKKIGDLPENLKTYRIYVDLNSEYRLQTVYGAPFHPLRFETSTTFYNHRWGNILGDGLSSLMVDSISYLLDSYITIGAATDKFCGIPLMDDRDGSLIDDPLFQDSDGFVKDCKIPEIVFYQLDSNIFNDNNSSLFDSEDCLIGVFGGAEGPDENNRILIAQLSTDGNLSFEMNIQIAKPGEEPILYTARQSINDSSVQSDELSFGLIKQ